MRRELTNNFLEGILRKYEQDTSIAIKQFEASNAVDVGENFVSDVKKVVVRGFRVVDGNETAYEIHLIVKLFPTNEEGIELPVKELFQNEMIAYNILIPELKKYTTDGSLPVPDCIYADASITVLKNLNAEGYANIDKYQRFSVEQVEYVLKVLAKLHSASIVMFIKDPTKFNKLSKLVTEVLFTSPLLEYQERSLRIAIRVFEELTPTPKNEAALKTLNTLKNTFISKMMTLYNEIRPKRVFIHGDAWSNNILVNDNKIILIDLQIMRCTSVASDLCYFLYVNMKPYVRRGNFDRLLNVYLDALNLHLSECNIEQLTMDWLLSEMREFSIYGVIWELTTLPLFHFKKTDLDVKENFKNLSSDDQIWELLTPEYKENVCEIVWDYMETIKS